jgi:hypothetical protein
MRTLRLLLLLALPVSLAQAQDAATMAAQQAAMQASQQASNQAMLAAQRAAQNAQAASSNTSINPPYGAFYISRPSFSVKPGSYPSTVTVKIMDSTRGAVIYYTTDGWTPTAASTRYTGPITISSPTHLQAVAVMPQLPLSRSRIASALYSLPASRPAVQASTVAATQTADGKLLIPKGTTVPLVFALPVSSHTAEVGEGLSLVLAEDLTVDSVLLAKKGTPVSAKVTRAYKSGAFGRPGELTFQVDDLALNGTVIKLTGTAALEGRDKAGTAMALAAIPPGIGAFLQHGKEAEIAEGTPFIASVGADTVLPPVR